MKEIILVGVAVSIIPSMASAQSTAVIERASPKDKDPAFGEIIVTAQKRSERLQDVPISITAATGDQLLKSGVTDASQLSKVVPGFTYQNTSQGTTVYSIRGVGFYDTSASISPTVSVYLDQAPLPYSVMARGVMLDLERVEVLKGPQGTLFGENSTGGAINFIVAKPTEDTHEGFDLTYGRFNQAEVGGYLSGKLADGLTARIAGRYEYRDGWQKRYAPANDGLQDGTLGLHRFATGRFLLDWQASSRLKFELNVNGWRDTSETQAQQFERFAPQSVETPYNTSIYDNLSGIPKTPDDDRLAGWDPGRDYQRNDWFYQINLRGDYDISDDVKLTSISSFDQYSQDAIADTDGTSYFSNILDNRTKLKSFYQELRLAGDKGSLKWMIGGNYSHDESDENEFADGSNSAADAGPVGFQTSRVLNHQNVNTYAAFGSIDYNITPTLTMSGSARYTKQDRSFVGCGADAGDGQFANYINLAFGTDVQPGKCVTIIESAPPFTTAADGVHKTLNEGNVSWRANLSWKLSHATLLYANVTKGYKAGGFSTIPAIFLSQLVPATQESLLAYETGFKLSALNRKVQLDGAVFYYKYDNKQLLGTAYIPPFGNPPQLVNIPRSRVVGAELQATLRPIDGLRLTAGGTYVNSRVQSNPGSPVDQFGNPTSFIGEDFPNTPRWQANGDVEYRFPVGSGSELYVGGNISWRSNAWAAFGDDAEFRLPAYALVDLRAGVSFGEKVDLQFWGRNVANQYYYTNVVHLGDTIDRITGMPSTYGVTLHYRY
jgi:iron complex outermembrane recepter protein